jgi:hypothetical protein
MSVVTWLHPTTRKFDGRPQIASIGHMGENPIRSTACVVAVRTKRFPQAPDPALKAAQRQLRVIEENQWVVRSSNTLVFL